MQEHDGHRARLKERFDKTRLLGFADHEVLELILFHSIPRRDTNPIAHALIREFGSLRGGLMAAPEGLCRVAGVGGQAARLLCLFAEVARRFFAEEALPISLQNTEDAVQYLAALFHGKINEHFYLFCLDTRYRILSEELVCEGSLSSAIVYPRKIAASALRHNAAHILIAHNHPGGDPTPSKSDIETTLAIVQAVNAIGVDLVDHLILGTNAYYSFASQTLRESCPQASLARAAQPALSVPYPPKGSRKKED